MNSVPVRTITIGVAEAHPLTPEQVERAVGAARRAEGAFRAAGYEVQTVRLATRPLFDDLAEAPAADVVAYGHKLHAMLSELGMGFCSVGPAMAARPGFPLERIPPIADLLLGAESLTCTVQLGEAEHGVRAEAAAPTARVIRRLAEESAEGFANFNFAALACVEPGGPFFPAAYHSGPASLAIGLQGAGIVRAALAPPRPAGATGPPPGTTAPPSGTGATDRARGPVAGGADFAQPGGVGESRGGLDPEGITVRVRDALTATASPVVELGRRVAGELGLEFGGIDLSPAPLGEDSIADAFELCGIGPFGSPGTPAIAAALTAAIRGTGLPTCGYNGLMLPVLEDATIGRRWAEGTLGVHQVLAYSAVCGTGLDTIPLPGDASEERIAALLLDVATLAVRLRKPLSARLFPVPGTVAGERTAFTSPYLTNTVTGW